MPRRCLFGPVRAGFGEQCLARQRREGECLCFDQAGAADLAVRPSDTWEAICARLPPGWRPQFVVLDLAYTSVPFALWAAPVPLIGLATDWHLLWSYYRKRLGYCDLVLTDTAGAETLGRA